MYALQKLDDDLVWIALPPPPGLSAPWGAPRNVFVLTGDEPALVDTGYAGSWDSLRQALADLDLSPRQIRRIALTSVEPDALGNAGRFPEAGCWLAAPAAGTNEPVANEPDASVPGAIDAEAGGAPGASAAWPAELRSAVTAAQRDRRSTRRILELLGSLDDRPPGWSASLIEPWAAAWEPLPAPPERLTLLREGMPLRLGRLTFEGIACAGGAAAACAWYSPEQRAVLGGPSLDLDPRPRVADPAAHISALGRIAQLSLRLAAPAHGLVSTVPDLLLRSASLQATNLRSNLQYVLNRPRAAWEVARDDLGYLPDDLLRFADHVAAFEAVLEEFAEAGVVVTDDSGPARTYRMGTPTGRVSPRRPA